MRRWVGRTREDAHWQDVRARVEIPPADLEVRTVPVPAGAAIFHHQDVWHGSEVNRSATQHRRALGVHLLRADCAFRAAPPPDYIYGRYYRGVRGPDEHFFPVVYRPGDEEVSGGTYLVE